MSKRSKIKNTQGQRPSGNVDMDRIKDLILLMKEQDVAELCWESSGEKLSIKTIEAFSVASMPMVMAPSLESRAHAGGSASPVQPSGASASAVASLAAANHKQITSPFVGTFYRSSSPSADPYIKEGQDVKPGDVLCIVEAMKLMNEIQSDYSGKVVSVLVENGQPVEFGEPLFIVQV